MQFYSQTTYSVVAAALLVRPGFEVLSETRRWHAAAPPGLLDVRPRLCTEAMTWSRSHDCTETQKTDEDHCCTQPTKTQSEQM